MISKITDEMREEYGNRTFERALYVFSAIITKPVTYSEANEVHRTGQTVRDGIKWSVIAPSQEYAEFAFDRQFRSGFRNVDPVIISVEVYPVCAEITKMNER